jgi:hypothetical protein
MKKLPVFYGAAQAVGLGLVLCLGCSGGSEKQFLPSEDVSRKALETALSAWQNGQPMENIGNGSPAIRVTDPRWSAGQKLSGYEILKEENQDGRRYYSVKLKLKAPAREPVVRYVVVGKDPLVVFDEDEYNSKTGM